MAGRAVYTKLANAYGAAPAKVYLYGSKEKEIDKIIDKKSGGAQLSPTDKRKILKTAAVKKEIKNIEFTQGVIAKAYARKRLDDYSRKSKERYDKQAIRSEQREARAAEREEAAIERKFKRAQGRLF